MTILLLPLAFRILPADGAQPPSTLLWLLDLAAHWQLPVAATLLVLCAAIGASSRRARRWWALMPLALAPPWTASPSLPQAPEDTQPALTVVAANVHLDNRDPRALVDWLSQAPADVVVLLELSPDYAEALASTAREYPHRMLLPDASPFGIGLLSRHPLRAIETQASADGIPLLVATLDTASSPTRLVAAHPMPPLDPHWRRERDRLLERFARDSGEIPTVVVGDLNATPWSTALLSPRSRLLARGTGLSATWRPLGGRVFGLPIDHVLASPHWLRVRSERGPDIGSDHLPIRVSLARARAAPS